MSLNWDATKVAESVRIGTRYENDGTPYEGLSVETETLIWGSMMVGIGTITEANAAEVYARYALYERINGAMMREPVLGEDGQPTGEYKDAPITPELVRAHIGLKTNVSPETKAQWIKKVVGRDYDTLVGNYKREVAKASEPQTT